MIRLYHHLKITLSLLAFVGLSATAAAQCPNVFDFYGQVNDNPYWYSCSGNNFTFNLSTPDTWNGFTIDWGDGTPVTSGATWAPPTFQTHVYPATVDSFVVTITETSSGCITTGVVIMEEASSASIQIPVGGLTQACAPQMMEFINSSTNVSETTTFTWDFGDGSPILVFDHTNWLQTIQHVYEVGTVTCETEVTLTAENYCNIVQGGNSTATFNPIRIWDLDDPAITASATLLCYPDTTVTFTNTTYRNCLFQGNIYQRYEWWNFGDYWGLGHDSIIDWTPWPPTFPRTMHYPGIGTYTVELLDSNFCGVAPTSITIQIVPPPVADIAVNPDTVCVGETVTFLQQSTGGANMWRWNMGVGNGWFNTGSGNITYVYNNPGTYLVGSVVGITGAAGCTDTAWVQVVVLPSPAVDISADEIHGCDSLTVNFDAITPNAISWDWDFGVAPFTFSGVEPPLIYYGLPGDYDVSLTVANAEGCEAEDHVVIHVHQSPEADFNVFDLCEGETATFNDISIEGPNDEIVEWNWDFGDGNTSTEENPEHLYTGTGSFQVTLQVLTDHCLDHDTMMVVVQDAPTAEISLDISQGCAPLTVQFTNNSDSAFVYHWNLGDGFETETFSGQHTFFNTGNTDTTYMITMSAMNAFGCGTSDTLYVTVHPGSIAGFLDDNNPPGCSPMAAFFVNTSQNAVGYLWDFGDGTTSNLVNPTHTYINNTGLIDSYDITLIAYNEDGCNDTITQDLIVYPLAQFDFSIGLDEGCAPHSVTMPLVGGIQNYFWDFGDGATSPFAIPTHLFNNNSDTTVVYNVTLVGTSAFGCVDTASAPVTVFPSPLAQFTADDVSGCAPIEVTFANQSLRADSYSWNYGDGTNSANNDSLHSHIFENTGSTVLTRQVILNATTVNGCSSQFSLSVELFPQITAGFVDPGSFCAPVTLALSNTSINAISYQWDFGNGLQSVSANPTTFYDNNTGVAQINEIALVAMSAFGCSDTVYHDVEILTTPVASFAANILSGCSPVEVLIDNNTLFADSLSWNYDDGNTSNTMDTLHTHTFYNFGAGSMQYDIVLSAFSDNGCASQFAQTITVYPGMNADFALPGAFCSPANIPFDNNSVGATSYQWDFDNGIVSAMANPTSYFENNTDDPIQYDVMLVATSSFGCTDTMIHPVIMNPTPVVQFAPDVYSGCSPLLVTFSNSTVHADTYLWSYGNGTTSTNSDSLHTHLFVNNGTDPITYQVALNAASAEGCTDQMTIAVVVYPAVTASFADPGMACSPATVSFDNNSTNAVSYQWEFGNGLMSVMPEPTSFYANQTGDPMIFDVMLIAMSAFGCADTATHDFVLNHSPLVAFSSDVNGGCAPLQVTLNNQTQFADVFAWSYGDGSTSSVTDTLHNHTYFNDGVSVVEYNVLLQASTDEGCSGQANATIQVYPYVVADFTDPGEHCSPVNVNFMNNSINGVAYQWDFGNGVQSIMEDPIIYFVNTSDTTQVYNVQLLVSSSYGCDVIKELPLVIHPKPVAGFSMSESAACQPSPVTITNSSTIATSFNWNYGDGETSSIADGVHVHDFGWPINNGSQYQIVLTALTDFGCVDTASGVFTLYPEVNAAFFADTIGCSPFNAAFVNQSNGAVSYQWTFGDGQVSSQNSPNHIYTIGNVSDEDFNVQLIAMNVYGCTDTASMDIYVKHTPVADAQVDTLTGCYPTVATFYNGSIGADSYQWIYGTGLTSTTDAVYHDYEFINVTSEVFTYQVTLQAFTNSGCMSIDNLTIDIAPEITASFFTDNEGCSPHAVYFDNTSDGGDAYYWNFGDGETSNAYEPQHTFFNWSNQDTTYTVMYVLLDSFGCSDTAYMDIHVFANPVAAFEVTPSVQTWPDAVVDIDNNTVGGQLNATWYMGDGNFIYDFEPGQYTYEQWGDYTIQLVVSNGSCSDTTYRDVLILPPPPVANFEGPAEGCVPLTVSFTNLSQDHVASSWAFGDGSQSTATNPVYTYWQPGVYTVSLTVTGADGSNDQMVQEQIIHVFPRAQAAFTVTPNEVNVPGEPVYCLNLSTNATSYQWDFGDGNYSSEENPLYYYGAEGEYDVTLIASNDAGCPDTMTLPGIVRALASGLIDFPNAFSPNPNGSSNGVFDPGSFDNDVFFPIHNGVEKYQLQIFNKWGELLFESNDVNRGWDGYYRGLLVKQDVYVWKVKAKFIDGRIYEKSGDVTLIVK
jgi:gliding motility-associated-like protein